MRAGEFPDGARTLRAKIDMASPNINLRDPVMYRIMHATHPRPGRQVVALRHLRLTHGQSDWIEASRIRFARWNSKTNGRSTTGTWTR